MNNNRFPNGIVRRAAWLGAWAMAAVACGAAPARDPSLLSSAYYPWPRQQQMVLDGSWSLAWTDPPRTVALPENLDRLDWFSAMVPGEVHWALQRPARAADGSTTSSPTL